MRNVSKLPNLGTTIFTVMSQMAKKHNAINLSQGFPNFEGAQELKDLACHFIQKGFNQYAPMAGVPALRDQLMQKNEALYGIQLNPDTEITVTAGATQAVYTAISAFTFPSDEVILFEPAYDSYQPAIEVCGGIPIAYKLRAPDYRVNWEAVEQLVSPKTKMLVINSPHNPSGTILEASDLIALEKLAIKHDLIVISDEVYEHLVYDGASHQSVLRFPKLFARSLVTFSFGKTFHNTGWKTGYCAAPEDLMTEFRKVHQFNVFCVNTPIQHALAEFLKKEENYLSLSPFFEKKRNTFLQALEASRFKPIPCKGTYFQAADYSAISSESDMDFARRMTTEYGVAVIPVSAFYADGQDDKIVRFCFAKTDETLEQAAEKLLKL